MMTEEADEKRKEVNKMLELQVSNLQKCKFILAELIESDIFSDNYRKKLENYEISLTKIQSELRDIIKDN